MGDCDSKLQQARINLPRLALKCERFQLSDCAGAAMANAVIKDLNSNNLLTKYDDSLIIDRSKLWRERVKYREEMRKNDDLQFSCINGIYMDGRKDATQVVIKEGGKYHQKTVIEEHYVVVGQPGEFYLTHVSPSDEKGRSIAQCIFSSIKATSLQETLAVVGSEGTAAMTGIYKGATRCLEELCERPLQWAICLLHCNELPLCHVFQALDGSTKSPDAFIGPIGQSVKGLVSEWTIGWSEK